MFICTDKVFSEVEYARLNLYREYIVFCRMQILVVGRFNIIKYNAALLALRMRASVGSDYSNLRSCEWLWYKLRNTHYIATKLY